MFTVLVSRTFQKQFNELAPDLRRRLRRALGALEEDPLRPRPGADIRPLEGTRPPKLRLRVGEYRFIYLVEGETVRGIELLRRGRGHRPVP